MNTKLNTIQTTGESFFLTNEGLNELLDQWNKDEDPYGGEDELDYIEQPYEPRDGNVHDKLLATWVVGTARHFELRALGELDE